VAASAALVHCRYYGRFHAALTQVRGERRDAEQETIWLCGVNVTSKPKRDDELEIETLRSRLTEAEEALQAISKGMIDAVVVKGPAGPRISTLAGAQEPYRLFVERMHEGALTLGADRRIVYTNRHLADLLGWSVAQLVGRPVADFLAAEERQSLAGLLDEGARRPASGELNFRRRDGSLVPALVAVGSLALPPPHPPPLRPLPAFPRERGRVERGLAAEGREGAVLLIVTDLTAQKHSEEVEAAEKFARAIVEQATDAVVVCDAGGRISKASFAAERLLGESLNGKLLADAIPMEVAPSGETRLSAAYLSSVRMSSGQVLELALRNHSLHGAEAQICLPVLGNRHFLLSAGPLNDGSGGCIGCILTLIEITDRKRTETQQTMLVAELNHRVKNILAIVQSVAWQTLSANQSPADFKQAFDGRLRALSLAHDILTQGRWGHVEFEQLVERSLAPYYGADNGPHVEWSGARLLLPPNMVVPLSMVLHELSTNAAKYGAFSVEHGRLRIAWWTDSGKVRFTWTETSGPPVVSDVKAGFGSKLISRVVSYDLAGAADLEFAPEGFRCTLTFPLPQTAAERPVSPAEPSPVH
jgi:PAS domain S-box-containing protein